MKGENLLFKVVAWQIIPEFMRTIKKSLDQSKEMLPTIGVNLSFSGQIVGFVRCDFACRFWKCMVLVFRKGNVASLSGVREVGGSWNKAQV